MKFWLAAILVVYSTLAKAQVYDFDLDSIQYYYPIDVDADLLLEVDILEKVNDQELIIKNYFIDSLQTRVWRSWTERSHNNLGQLIRRYYSTVPNVYNDWMYQSTQTYEYNEDDLLINYKNLKISGLQMDTTIRGVRYHDHDEFGNHLTREEYYMSDDNELQSFYYLERFYSNLLLDSVVTYLLTPALIDDQKLNSIHYTYNDDNQILIQEEWIHNTTNQIPVMSHRTRYEYNSEGLVSLRTSQSDYDPGVQYLLYSAYDDDNRLAQQEYYTSYDTGLLSYDSRLIYYRPEISSTTKQADLDVEIIWTNPSSEILEVEMKALDPSENYALKIINVHGVVVNESQAHLTENFREQFNLVSGWYALMLMSETGSSKAIQIVIN